MKFNYIFFIALFLATYSCQSDQETADAYGNFEATEILVSAEVNGRLIYFDLEEGEQVDKNTLVGIIDTTLLFLKKQQLEKSIQTIRGKTSNVQPQLDVFTEQIRVLRKEEARIKGLIKVRAATEKQLDDIIGQIKVLEKRILATRDQSADMNSAILGEIDPLRIQIEQINDQLARSYIHNPIAGIVLTKLAEKSEIVGIGRPIYSIADTRKMILRAYISGQQLSDIEIGQQVVVLVDDSQKEYRNYEGTISWVSAEAEFTPKIVQTKDERVNLVYAIKVSVPNDGKLKIGMPAEMYLNNIDKKETVQ
jgi:HlyD family secretion protein